MIKRIGLFGDLHAGSWSAPWPIADLPSDEARHSAVRYLTECLGHFVENCPKLDVLILNGDLIDGAQRKQGGMGLFAVSLGDQVKGAIELLRPLAKKAKRIIRITGTPYHDDGNDPLYALDLALGVERCTQVLDLVLGEHEGQRGIMNVAHHPEGGSTLYPGTKNSREIRHAILAQFGGKVPQGVKWIVRSHLHHFAHHIESGIRYLAVPCWQLPTPYATKGAHWKWQPDIGAIVLEHDGEGMDPWRYRIRHFDYDLPAREVVA